MRATWLEILRADGHMTGDGRCDKCWREAALLYYGGTEFETQTEAYYHVTREAEAEARRRVAVEAVDNEVGSQATLTESGERDAQTNE